MLLLTEYCRRKNSVFLLGTNEGLCFFDDSRRRPSLICLTGTSPKCYTTCHQCPEGFIVEIIVPSREEHFSFVNHEHVAPDTDLIKYVSAFYPNYTPHIIHEYAELELWLWDFFTFHHKVRHMRSWKSLMERQQLDNAYHRIAEQMAFVSLKIPRVFRLYYHLYETVILGRKYLFYE